jgi:CheY-like chemotaxis protein
MPRTLKDESTSLPGHAFCIATAFDAEAGLIQLRPGNDSTAPQAHLPGDQVRVLIVDDDGDCMQTLASLLELLGYELQTAADGLRGLDTAERFRPQCVVLDIDLPGLDGLDIARRLRRAPWGRETLLIATTGWDRDEDRSAAMVAGFDHFLPKPLNIEALISLLPPPRVPAQGTA